jgi:hypothetical protein
MHTVCLSVCLSLLRVCGGGVSLSHSLTHPCVMSHDYSSTSHDIMPPPSPPLPDRGSSSDKIFTVLIVLCAVAGFLGSVRWHAIGDASHTEALLCQVGFAAMILVVAFEVPVNPQTFFQDKLLLTYWMMKKLKLQPYLDFKISPTSRQFLEFIRNSEELRGLYEEDAEHEMQPVSTFATFTLGFNLHAIGASTFVSCITLAIILNDSQEHRVLYITGFFFVMFCVMGYISGEIDTSATTLYVCIWRSATDYTVLYAPCDACVVL